MTESGAGLGPTSACPIPGLPARPPLSFVQGLTCLGLSTAALTALFTDLTNLAAFDSLAAGLLPAMERRQLDNLLASFG